MMVSAQDSDGVIEAVEIPGENFVLAVQWHPEERLDDLRLFAGVVQAAAYATQKVAPGGRSAGGTPHASGGPTHPQGRGRVRA